MRFSAKWKKSKQPRKQRKYRYNAPMHRRRKLVSAHLSASLRKEYKRRSISLRKGDEVVVMRGKHKGKRGKIEKVSLKKMKVFIENVKQTKPSGQEVTVPIEPSNLKIVSLFLEDKKRAKILRRKRK